MQGFFLSIYFKSIFFTLPITGYLYFPAKVEITDKRINIFFEAPTIIHMHTPCTPTLLHQQLITFPFLTGD